METETETNARPGGFLAQLRPCGECGKGVLVMYGELAPLKCWEHN